jgi:DNA-binding NtrC family response regulator
VPKEPLVIVVDDEPEIIRVHEEHLCSWGYRMMGAANEQELLGLLERELPVVVLLDLFLDERDGLEVLGRLQQSYPELLVVMLTGQGSIATAVRAVKLGAYEYLTKPPDLTQLRRTLERATELHTLNARMQRLTRIEERSESMARLWGASAQMQNVKSLVNTVALTDATVLVLGETGTGKELTARALHELSERRDGPFVPVNMAALPRELVEATLFGHEKGAFTGAVQTRIGCCEAAAGGTLFLDEIGEMDLAIQAKILRFLQDRTVHRIGAHHPIAVNVRVVTATNQDLLHLVRSGRFREDLFYRLNVIPIHLPPLRDRREDIPTLSAGFLKRFASKYEKSARQYSADVTTALMRYDWPGNIRQLENTVERMVVLSSTKTISLLDLPAEIRSASATAIAPASVPTPVSSGYRRMEEIERQTIGDALKQTEGNVRAAARLIGLSVATVYRKIKQFGLAQNAGLNGAD